MRNKRYSTTTYFQYNKTMMRNNIVIENQLSARIHDINEGSVDNND